MKTNRHAGRSLVIAVFTLCCISAKGAEQEAQGEGDDAAELAKKLANPMNTKSISKLTLSTLALTLLLSGCQSTYQSRKVEPSGFLQNVSQLRKGEDGEAKLVYINPKADFKRYTKIMMAPVIGYGTTKRGSIRDLSKEDQKKLLNYFDAIIRKELSTSYQLVESPGPDVMKLRVAVTDARGSHVVLDTVSSIIPISIAVSAVKAVATGKNLAVGEIGAEMEVLDSQSGERLAAAIDDRVGRKYTFKFDKFNRWHTAEDAFEYWAETIQHRLGELSK